MKNPVGWLIAAWATTVVHAASVSIITEDDMRAAVAAEGAAQAEAAKQANVFHGFRFQDRIVESGITFTNTVSDDAAKNYKAAHYDHGTGVAAADVDGDGLTDLFFVNQLGGNQLWRNAGGGRFEDVTAKSGTAMAQELCVAATFADLDNDGDPDLLVSAVRGGGNALFENKGEGRFENVTQKAGFSFAGHSSGLTVFDFNNDGRLDVFVCNVGKFTGERRGRHGEFGVLNDAFSGHLFPERYEKSLLYRNEGEMRFKEVSAEAGLEHRAWSGDASVADVDGNGFLDLYVLNMQGDDRFYLNRDGKRFEEARAANFPKTPWGAMGIKFFDYNLDGRIDLYLTDMHSDMPTSLGRQRGKSNPLIERSKSEPWCTTEWTQAYLQGSSNNIFGNAFYQKSADGGFAEVSDKIGAETFWPWGVSVADVNADGTEDVFVTAGMGFPFPYSKNSLLLNENGSRFVEAEFLVGIEPRKDNRVGKDYFVLDCSGADRGNRFCSGRTGMVPIRGTLSTRSSVFVDLEGDGDLDLVTNEFYDRPQVLLSNLSEQRRINFLKVKLTGTKSNRDGLGAIVTVSAGGKTMTRSHDGKSGFLGQSSLPLYFGLGEAARADSVRIKWPSGAEQEVTGEAAGGELLEVREP